MGKTKTKIIDDSKPVEEAKPSFATPSAEASRVKKASGGKKPKDTLAASLLEELNKEFGEVKEKGESVKGEGESKKESPQKASTTPTLPKTAKAKPRGKKYLEAVEKIDKAKNYPLKEAIELVKSSSYSKFEGTVEAHINTHVKNIRGLVSLPYASGKKLVIVAFGKGAEGSGADIVGNDQILETISKGKLDAEGKKFDYIVTTPEWMPKLARAARVLGPRGMMPNPKNGTITDNLKKAVSELQGGKTEYKSEKDAQVIHLGIGKVTQPNEELEANLKLLYSVIGKSKIKKITLSPTMGPGVKVNLGSI